MVLVTMRRSKNMDDAPNLDGSSTNQMSQTTQPQEQEGKGQQEGKETAEKKPGFQFPSTFAILFAVMIIVAILTYIIPAGVYKLDANGDPIPGSYHQVASSPQGVSAILLAPINGMYGILSKSGEPLPEHTPNEAGPGNVSVYNEGELYGSIGVALFVLV